jgi:hypothetical protein
MARTGAAIVEAVLCGGGRVCEVLDQGRGWELQTVRREAEDGVR